MIEVGSQAKNKCWKPLLFLVGFYLIYQPNFWANTYLPMIVTLGIMMSCVLVLSPTNCQIKCNFLPKKTSDGVFQPKTLRGRLFKSLTNFAIS